MIEDIKKEVEAHNRRAIGALDDGFNKIRTGRANPAILDSVMVNYYGTPTQLKQVANINVEDGRTLAIVPWEKNLVERNTYIHRDVPILDYLHQLATIGEDPNDYMSIWYYF